MGFKKVFATAVSAAFILGSLTACAAPAESVDGHDEIHLENGWVRVSEYSAEAGGMTGAFAEISNHTANDVTLVGGSSPSAMMVEVHEVVMVGGEMKMQAKDGGIVIKAGETITLEPGGLHVMLMGLKAPLLGGETVSLTLDFDGADDITVEWPAKASLAGDESYAPKG
jgi:copper(I)-binding protein